MYALYMLRRSYQPLLITAFSAVVPFILLAVKDKKTAIYDLAFATPYLVAALIGFLSLKLSQRRIFFVAVALAAIYGLAENGGETWLGMAWGARVQGLAVALPLAWLALFLIPEKHPLASGSAYAVSIALPLAAVFLALHLGGDTALLIIRGRAGGLGRAVGIPQLGILSALLFAVSTVFAKDRFTRDFRIFACVALVPALYVLGRSSMPDLTAGPIRLQLACGFVSAGTILTYAVFRLYWQKVFVDELTGIPNRRALNDRLNVLKSRYAIAMTDIDHFKRFNDTYGHEEGDNVLRFVAKHLDAASGGNAYRYGGEEICVVLEGKSAVQATKIMDLMRRELSKRNFHIRQSKKARALTSKKDRDKGGPAPVREAVHVTISVGVAGHGESLQRPEDVLIAADAALYRAKELGRDRVLMAQIGSGGSVAARR